MTLASVKDLAQVNRELHPDLLLQAAHIYGNNPVFVVEANTRRILAASAAVERVFGYPPEETVGWTTEFLHVDEKRFRVFDELSAPSVAAGEAFRCHYQMRRLNGEAFDTEHFIHPVTDEADRLLAVVSIVRDLSDPDTLPLPSAETIHRQVLDEKIPGAVFQWVRRPDGSYSYNFFRGDLLSRLGLTASIAKSDSEAMIQRLSQDERQRLLDHLERTATSLSVLDLELSIQAESGEMVCIRGISQPCFEKDGSVVWDGILLDMTDQRHSEHELYYLTTHDYLTGLPNQKLFEERINAVIPEVRETGEKLLVGILNIDRFRSINQVYGFSQGDDLLRQLADRLQTVAHSNNMVARFHGDEFLFFFQGLKDEEAVSARVHNIIHCFAEPMELGTQERVSLTAQFGLTMFPDQGETAEDLCEQADVALRHTRAKSEQTFAFYSRTMSESVIASVELEKALSWAIESRVIEAHYQPQYELASGRLCGFETLARWPREDGWVSPGRFVPLAEETGLIYPLSSLMVEKTLSDIVASHHADLVLPPVAINISALALRRPEFTDWLVETLTETGVTAEDVVLEITESAFLHNFERALEVMTVLESHGLQFSMDDFGTGYSSLSYLSKLPFHILKVDKSFVEKVDSDPRTRAVVNGIIDLSHNLNLKVVAEGVEREEQLKLLQEMGCDVVQGFLFARPEPLENFHEELRANRPHHFHIS